MPNQMAEKTLLVSGMVCSSCETRIQKRIAREPGVESARVDYKTGLLRLRYDPGIVDIPKITNIIAEMDYSATESDGAPPSGKLTELARSVGVVFLLLGVAFVGNRLGLFSLMNVFPEAEAGMGLGMIFLTGVLTSVHCLAMCGGINLSQTALSAKAIEGGKESLSPTFLYAAGRVLSYTLIGAAVGGVGSAFSLSSTGKAGIQIVAGIFMALMGMNLMGLFPRLRRIIPRLPNFFGGKHKGSGRNGPFFVGLLNGFMPCGPLQAMQLFALSTGSPVRGALAMAAFAVGTLPLTMGVGIFASRLGKRFMGKAIRVGAALVFLMGVSMLSSGLSLAGVALPSLSGDGEVITSRLESGKQLLETTLLPDAFQPVRVRPGVPLVWNISVDAASLNGCNNRIVFPTFGIEQKLAPGENIIEFTPDKPGIYPYTCWMGMITSRIIVGDVADSGENPEVDPSMLPEAGDEYAEDVPWL